MVPGGDPSPPPPPPFFLLIEGIEEMNSVDDLRESIYVLFYSNMYSFGWFDKCLCLSFQSISSVSRYL